MLTLGWKASPEQWSPEDLLEFAVEADRAGFDSIDVSDHFHPWAPPGQSCFTWSWLGAAAARTSKIELGTGVTCPILRYNPVIIAQAAATVQRLSHGGFFLGVGTGEALNEYPCTAEWPDYYTRQDMVREAIGLMRLLWSGDEITFDGDYFSARKAALYTPPKSMIPVYISSLVPESAYFAGYYGDGLITVGGVNEELLRNFEHGARDAGKDPAAMPKQIAIHAELTDDVETALAPYRKYWKSTHIHAMYLQKIYTPGMAALNGEAIGDDTLKKGILIASDPEAHARKAQELIDAGFNRIHFNSASLDQAKFIRDFAGQVLPIIRDNNRDMLRQPGGAPAGASSS
jgi:coenzyme F420-dependent glucose-6-phosphate dehydrogenase